jgi:hypothetical protein
LLNTGTTERTFNSGDYNSGDQRQLMDIVRAVPCVSTDELASK